MPVSGVPETRLIRLFAEPVPTASSSAPWRLVRLDTTCWVASTVSGGGATGVVYHLMTRKAATSSAMPATTATGATQEGVRDTGLRIGRGTGGGFAAGRLIRLPW